MPVVHETAVVWVSHVLELHAVPVVQDTQPPVLLPLQTFPAPQFVPAGLAPLAKHWLAPVEQETAVIWAWQRLVLSHAVPVMQETQLPRLLQVTPEPHVVPGVLLPVAKHWFAPVVHEIAVVCASQGLPLLQAVPEVQVEQAPLPSHTLFEPHVVPGDLLPVAKHWLVPVVHEIAVVWVWQRLVLSHAVPVVQATQLPLPLHTMLEPQF
jgi:hypothetical protein